MGEPYKAIHWDDIIRGQMHCEGYYSAIGIILPGEEKHVVMRGQGLDTTLIHPWASIIWRLQLS